MTRAPGKTLVTIDGERFLLNGVPTYAGRTWRGRPVEGLLMNARLVQATFDDENPLTRTLWSYPDTGRWDPERNTDELVAALPAYQAQGLRAVTLNLQGGCPTGYFREEQLDEILAPLTPEARAAVKAQRRGRLAHVQPWLNSAFDPEGRLKTPHLARLARVLDRLDELGMVAILGLYYFGQDERLSDSDAVTRGLDATIAWVLERGAANVLIEVANEADHPAYEHAVLRPERVHELIERARAIRRGDRRLAVGTSYRGGRLPHDAVVAASDFVLLHGNGIADPAGLAELIGRTRALPAWRARPKPIVVNEDDHFGFEGPRSHLASAVESYASWGFFDGGAASGGRVARGDYRHGYQLVPVNWTIDTPVKRGFFVRLAEITGARAEAA